MRLQHSSTNLPQRFGVSAKLVGILVVSLLTHACTATIFVKDKFLHNNASSGGADSLPDVKNLESYKFMEALKSGENGWNREYSAAVVQALKKPQSRVLLSGDETINDPEVARICPRYNALSVGERGIFWTLLLAAMAKHESSYNNNSIALHDGGGNSSIGLLQLSYEDMVWAQEWGCNVSRTDESRKLTKAAPNLECGVAIMARQVSLRAKKNGASKVFLGSEEYWSVLRPSEQRGNYNVTTTFLEARDPGAAFCVK
jgi:hypothetical protein